MSAGPEPDPRPRTIATFIPSPDTGAVLVDTRSTPGIRISCEDEELIFEELSEDFVREHELLGFASGRTDDRRVKERRVNDQQITGKRRARPRRSIDRAGLQARKANGRVDARDPWAHRSKGMKCGTCMWFVPKAPDPSRAPPRHELGQGQLGRCRRRAPTMSGYPATFETDWCGDHKLDENKAGLA